MFYRVFNLFYQHFRLMFSDKINFLFILLSNQDRIAIQFKVKINCIFSECLNLIFMFPAYRQAGVRNERSVELMKICTSIVPYGTKQSLLFDISTDIFSLREILNSFSMISPRSKGEN
jgi:hypothetical protein